MPPVHCIILARDSGRRRALEDVLQAAGHRVVPAATPGEAAEAVATSGMDYLILDLSLPLLELGTLQRAIHPSETSPPDSLEAAERRHIALTLRHTGGNRRQAARLLGIARSTMLAKLRKYGLEDVRADGPK